MTQKIKQLTTPSLNGTSVEEKRAELKEYFLNSWTTYESLFNLINNDNAYYLRPEPLRHPLIFYYGHTATFYINKLMLGKFINKRLNERLEAICAVGVDEMSWDDLDSNHYDWPSVDEVRTYRNDVKTLVVKLIDTMELSLPICQDSLAWIILMGSEHERIHLETSSVIMRMLPLEHLTANGLWQACADMSDAPENKLIAVEQKQVILGKDPEDQTYGWDNEYGHEKLDVPSFSASQYLVSNQEFMAFVQAGGYDKPEYWTEEGQNWLNYKQPKMPRFWFKENGNYYQRNLVDVIPLPLNWPVEVNYLEAKAFCNWKSQLSKHVIRLPSEPEWYALHEHSMSDSSDEINANVNLSQYASSCPVDRNSQGELYDLVGNVWQWTESEIDAFEGFKVHPLYDDFSTPTFDGKHNLIKGGSWISTGNETIKSARYAFRRHFFQHAGFRYIASDSVDIPKIAVNHFETNMDICQQLESHYAAPSIINSNYQQDLADKIAVLIEKYQVNTKRLLDIGCSVGRSSFELSRYFNHVDGVDFSARLIQHGVQLQSQKSLRYAITQQGELVDFKEIQLNELDLPVGSNLLFSQGDAGNLKAIFTDYDVILAQHLIENHYDPALFFKQVHQRLNSHGVLVVVTDYRFDEKTSNKKQWFGGIKVNGENVTGAEGLKHILAPHFDLIAEDEMTQELKNDQRNYQISRKHLTVWQVK